MKIRTYVVNMLKDTAKRAQIEAQLAKHPELDYQIWKAVEGRKLTEQEQKERILPGFKLRYGKSASLPAAGCSLSHGEIYKDIIENDIQYVLILEDDARLANDLKIDACVEILKSDKPIAILLTSDFWYMKDALAKTIDDKHTIFKLYDGYMTSGYMINKAGAELLYKVNYPVQYTADAWKIFIEKGLTLYGIVPHVVSFPDGCGEIGMAGNTPTKGWKKYRSKLIKVYLEILWCKKYLSGHRRSKKLWR